MKILLLGATGRTGKLILKELLGQRYQINCLVREPEKINETNKNLTVLKGSPQNFSDLRKAFKGCDAIISALNISRKSDFPWSKLKTPPNFLSEVTRNIISLTKAKEVRRIIVCSAWGVAETKTQIPFWFRLLIHYSNIGIAYRDHENQENELKKSSLNWTIVRPSVLTNFKRKRKVIESYQNSPKPKLTISRENVAKFMVDALTRNELIRQIPTLSE